jgi:hypothetical protein
MSANSKVPSLSVIKGHRYHPFKESTPGPENIHPSASAVSSHDGAQSKLCSSPLLDYLGFRFHREYTIMICVVCSFALLPGSCLGHAHNQHSISTTKEQKELWSNLVAEWKVTTNTFIAPPEDRHPVDLLTIHPDAYCCNLCSYGALSSRSFANHWTANHRSNTEVPPDGRYYRGHVQTFYQHVHCRYFQLDLPIPNSTPLFDLYIKDEVSTYESFDVTIPSAPREIPPLLYQTKWHEHLETYIKEKKNRRTLMTLAHPEHFTKDPLWKLTWNYVTTVANIAKRSSMRVRCILQEYPR